MDYFHGISHLIKQKQSNLKLAEAATSKVKMSNQLSISVPWSRETVESRNRSQKCVIIWTYVPRQAISYPSQKTWTRILSSVTDKHLHTYLLHEGIGFFMHCITHKRILNAKISKLWLVSYLLKVITIFMTQNEKIC